MAELFTILGIIVTVLSADAFVCALVTLYFYDTLDDDAFFLPSLIINIIGCVFAVTANIMGRIS